MTSTTNAKTKRAFFKAALTLVALAPFAFGSAFAAAPSDSGKKPCACHEKTNSKKAHKCPKDCKCGCMDHATQKK